MVISKMFANAMKYISEAAMRIFAPTDDSYPVIGVQPLPIKKSVNRTCNSSPIWL
ncbi:MAG: nicotinate phosphoribosyltransferase [Cyanobacteria bacterium J06639_18]